jgi:iron-sulfur cluster assembly accessory protein
MSDCGNVQNAFVNSSDKDQKSRLKQQNIQGVSITSKAAEKIKYFCEVDCKSFSEFGLRVSVVSDGCSGKSYTMSLSSIEDAQKNADKIFVHNGASLIIEKLSYLFVIGSELDFKETLLASGFELTNPNVKKSCSCGSSFSV